MTPALEAAEVDALRVIFTSLGATVADVGAAMALADPTAQVQVPDGALIDEAPTEEVLADQVLADRGLVVWSRLVRLVAATPNVPTVTDLALVRVGRGVVQWRPR